MLPPTTGLNFLIFRLAVKPPHRVQISVSVVGFFVAIGVWLHVKEGVWGVGAPRGRKGPFPAPGRLEITKGVSQTKHPEEFLIISARRRWNRLPLEVGSSPFLESFQQTLDGCVGVSDV